VIKPVARLAVVCAALAAAYWLLPATVAVASWPSTGPIRVAFLPPLRIFWIALAGSMLLVAAVAYGWRATGRSLDGFARTTAPLSLLLLWTVPFLPKLADLAPTLLVLAGPMRWVVAAAAFGGAAGELWQSEGFELRVNRINRRALFAVAFSVYAAMGIRFAQQVGFNGDEPHYLVIAHSLLADRDLDIANNHEQRDYRSFFSSTLGPDFLKRGTHGEIYSIHAPGLPAMLVPAYALGGGTGAVIFVALLAALASVAIVDLASRLVSPAAALVTWAAVSFSVPFVPHAWLIYPEIVAALIVARAVFRLWEPPESSGKAAINGFMLAILPWLHTKFIVLTAALAMFEALRLWPKIKHIVALGVPIAASVVLWLFSFYWMYGVFDPQAPYGGSIQTVVAANIPRGVLGLLFDQKFGLLIYSPLYLLAVPGIVLLLRQREHRLPTVAAITTAVLFLAATTRFYMWWGGSSAPARFLVPIVPLLAPLVAYGVAGLTNRLGGRALVVSTVLFTIGIALVAAASTGERLLYSDPHGFGSLVRALQGPASLDLILPTFTEENLRTPIMKSLPWLVALAIAAGTMIILARRHAFTSAFWMALTPLCLVIIVSGLLTARPPIDVRVAAATRGQFALLHAFDPSRFRAINASQATRMTDDAVRDAARVEIRYAADAPSTSQPIELPQGVYEARIWFDGDSSRSGDLGIVTPAGAVIARQDGPQENPTTVQFEMPVTAAIQVRLSDPASQSAVRRVEITAASLVARSARAVNGTVAVEPLGEGSARGYLAYVDDSSYPEHGVFWTSGTDQTTVVVVKDPGGQLRLVLHVGPSGGNVDLGVDRKRLSFQLKPNETRDVPIDLAPGTVRTVLSIRTDRAFVPASIEKGSSDRRSLGCQVRPVVF